MSKKDISTYFSFPAENLFGAGEMLQRLPSPRWFSSGRDCFLLVSKLLGQNTRLFVPEYFCTALKNYLKDFFNVSFYTDNPFEPCADFSGIKISDTEKTAVLFCDYFGLKERRFYDEWAAANPNVIVIEDHSHSPFSDWALTSTAHFTIASLRKTLPIADGAYIYSKKVNLPKLAALKSDTCADFANDIYRAFALKEICEKQTYIKLFLRGEEKLANKRYADRQSDLSYEILHRLNIEKICNKRKLFGDALESALTGRDYRVVNSQKTNAQFLPILLFKDTFQREQVRKTLIENKIYPQVFWNFSKEPKLESIAEKTLTVPFDLNSDIEYSVQKISGLI